MTQDKADQRLEGIIYAYFVLYATKHPHKNYDAVEVNKYLNQLTEDLAQAISKEYIHKSEVVDWLQAVKTDMNQKEINELIERFKVKGKGG